MKNKIEVGDLVGHRAITQARGIVIKLEHLPDTFAGGRWYAWVLWVASAYGPNEEAKYLTRDGKNRNLVTLAKGSNK